MYILLNRQENPNIPDTVTVEEDLGVRTFYVEAKGGGARRVSGRYLKVKDTPELHQWLATQRDVYFS